MVRPHPRPIRFGPLAVFIALWALGTPAVAISRSEPPPVAQPPAASTPATPATPASPAAPALTCSVDLTRPGQMADLISNVLIRSESKPEREVRAFLTTAKKDHAKGESLLLAAAARFAIDPDRLRTSVNYYRHINCHHGPIPGFAVPDHFMTTSAGQQGEPLPTSEFAGAVALHVVLHEMGHAVIREFDLMVLGNEETMADAFATHMLTEHFPDLAPAAIKARVTSLMIEAGQVPRADWPVRGEHDNDARRAFQIAALALAADQHAHAPLVDIVGMSESDVRAALDYGSDIHRAWRRTLAPLLMPRQAASKEGRLRAAENLRAFLDHGPINLGRTLESAVKMIDWHSQVTIDFVEGKGGASWSRSNRTITVNDAYLCRFIAQGELAKVEPAPRRP